MLDQEFNHSGKAVNNYVELYGTSSHSDLHIGGWTTQNGPISYPQDYNWNSKKGQTDPNLLFFKPVHIELLNVSDSGTLLRNGFLANSIKITFTLTGS